jgi:hypothetical protein
MAGDGDMQKVKLSYCDSRYIEKENSNMLKWSLLYFLLILPVAAYSQDISKSFPNLAEIKVATRWDVRVMYNPKVSTIINKKYHDSDPDSDYWKVIKTRIGGTGQEYRIEFSEGASDDPTFKIFKDEEAEPVFEAFATGLVIPGNGFIYTSGHTNNMFDERKKYELRKGQIVEVKQPYYYVGLATKTNKAITLHSAKDVKGVVAALPAGAPVTVLINEVDFYLLKTEFGLVGWAKIGTNNSEGTIDGLVYAGD